jgi:hypothetical protein
MYEKHTIGSDAFGQIYVWTIGTKRNTKAVISAHGAQTWSSSGFKVPDTVTLWFYQPNGYLLQDPGLINVIYDEVKPKEHVTGGKYQDYSLSKYQGAKHGSEAESYKNIPAFGITETELTELGWTKEQLSTMKRPRDDLDIITIRNRRMRSDPTLKEVIKEVTAAGYAYTDYYCSFCRGPTFGKETGSWDARQNT